jgi:hypothetical protein
MQRRSTMATVPCTVTVEPSIYKGSPPTWRVDPDPLRIRQDDDVDWTAQWKTCKAVPTIVVHPKPSNTRPWPFPKAPHHGTNTASAKKMIKNAHGHYKYGIVVICPGQGAVVIDPDMDVLG